MAYPQRIENLNPNEVYETELPIEVYSESLKTTTCKLIVSDVKDRTKQDICIFNIEVTPLLVCTRFNEVYCSGNDLVRCNADGSAEELIEHCKYGCMVIKGVAKCVPSPECHKEGEPCVRDSDCCGDLICTKEGVCAKEIEECDFKCDPWDIPCKWNEFMCKLEKGYLKFTQMLGNLIVLIVILIIAILILWKVILGRKSPAEDVIQALKKAGVIK